MNQMTGASFNELAKLYHDSYHLSRSDRMTDETMKASGVTSPNPEGPSKIETQLVRSKLSASHRKENAQMKCRPITADPILDPHKTLHLSSQLNDDGRDINLNSNPQNYIISCPERKEIGVQTCPEMKEIVIQTSDSFAKSAHKEQNCHQVSTAETTVFRNSNKDYSLWKDSLTSAQGLENPEQDLERCAHEIAPGEYVHMTGDNQIHQHSGHHLCTCHCISRHSESRHGFIDTCCNCNIAQPQTNDLRSECNCGVENMFSGYIHQYFQYQNFSPNSWQIPRENAYDNGTCSGGSCAFARTNPDIFVTSQGRCMIGSSFYLPADQSCRRYYINGFDVTFVDNVSFPDNIYVGIRLDFNTACFAHPESFETEVDDRNIFVTANIFGDLSRLRIFLEHYANPERINVEHPGPFLFTIEIPR